MANTRRELALTSTQRRELEVARDRHPRAHMREKAAVLLKIADGLPAYRAATEACLKARTPKTIYSWLDKYEAGGLTALEVAEGRGRKPAFFPLAE